MKRGLYIVLLITAVIAGISCSKTKSYTDYLNDQKDAINKLISEKDFIILNDFPKDTVFKEKEYVNLGGLYLRIIKRGDEKRAVEGETKILCRVQGFYPSTEDSTSFNTFPNGMYPFEFTYNVLSNNDTYQQYFLSEGLNIPLQFVGDGAEVSLIVPFQIGSTTASSYYEPVFFERVRYLWKD